MAGWRSVLLTSSGIIRDSYDGIEEEEVRTRTTGVLIGGLVGALLGALAAWIILEEKEGVETGPAGRGHGRRDLSASDILKVLMSAVALVQQIAKLRQRV
jgi:hypothetical protein